MNRLVADEAEETVQNGNDLDSLPLHSPGALRGEVWMTLHTRHAQRLFMGRKASQDRPSIISLTRYGAILSQLFVCVHADDPYADWWLVKVEEALQESEEQLGLLRQSVEQKLCMTKEIAVGIAESLEPIKVPLKFRNPYAYSAARLLASFDNLVRGILTARHVGLLDRKESERYLQMGARAVRRALGTAQGYRYEGIKRQDLIDNNAKAQQAREKMGDVPVNIFEGNRVARLAPARVSLAQGHARRRPAIRMAELDTRNA